MRLCVPVRTDNYKKAREMAKKVFKFAAKHKRAQFLIEIWLDSLADADAKRLIDFSPLPVIAVCRGSDEKGVFKGSQEEAVDVLAKAISNGAKFADVDIQTNPRLAEKLKKTCKKFGAKLIVSQHFRDVTPEIPALESAVEKARKLGADIVKIAAAVKNWSDNAALFELTDRARCAKRKIIVVGMGPRGRISRIGCLWLGSYLTYVALDENSKTAPGQLTLNSFRKNL